MAVVYATKETNTVSITSKPFMVICGSHDHCVYCWSGNSNENVFKQLWKVEVDSDVYSIPCFGVLSSQVHDESKANVSNIQVVCAASAKGKLYIIDAIAGRILGQSELPQEIYSSPVVIPGNQVIFGCRDDNIYCLDIEL